ncbi:hypothetical protein [Chitinasiproducens palmae]|uniref:Uncharacterized protein n=1 Tax=Chitinasiproducens palmae TaxID=1770053 RepID=A0A1H2PJA0_9BURK|nr:hypothetical protein [Chitinasiproducens palmae]SDV46307.1 hypothetical protein SAMN05216551_101243 [Chitinasiproducens palmae]
MRTQGASGGMVLLVEVNADTASAHRTLRLEATPDGKSVLLIDRDERKPGIHREVRYEITPAELIATIRAHGAELPGEGHQTAG